MATDLEKELERTAEMRGFRFGMHDFVGHLLGVEALKKHNDNSAGRYLKKGLLERKTKELAIIAACVALKDNFTHLQCHMWAAHKAGATPEEILELIDLVSQHAGNVAKANGLEAWRILFRPELPTIYSVDRR